MFEKHKVNNLQALIFNYITAGILSYIFLYHPVPNTPVPKMIKTAGTLYADDISLEYIINSGWLFHAIVLGILFIVVFNLYALGIQKAGIAITTVANKMSLIIPVSAAIILYGDTFTFLKATAFFLALTGIYLSSTQSGTLIFNKKYLWLIILIFLGQGICDAIFNDFSQKFNHADFSLFFIILFFTASISGIIIHVIKLTKKKKLFHLKSIFWGFIFGVTNFFCMFFFLKALRYSHRIQMINKDYLRSNIDKFHPIIDSSAVFALVSIGIVVSSSLVGRFAFKEKLSKTNWIGILLAICAIYFFSY